MYVCIVYTYYGIEERERRKLHLMKQNTALVF